MNEDDYPDPICQTCGNKCETSEEVDVGISFDERYSKIELWNYCDDCDIETFHPIPKHFDDK
jgi:hypothetical protein